MHSDPAFLDSSCPTVGDVGAGSAMGPYELLLPIAQGGMALVWVARQKGGRGFQKLVALKSMHAYLSKDARFEQLFLAEAEFASRIQHPNVCSIHDLGEERGRLYLAMEWVDGDTLATLEEQHPEGMPIPIATRIAADVATGLHAAHELRDEQGELVGLVHCDVSPQNILITLDGLVKVADFGLARATTTARHRTHGDGFAGGKPSFMAPEQARGDLIDRRTDVFALGIVLYRLLTGHHPFEGETSRDRLQRMLDPSARVPEPHSFRQCSRPLSDAVMRALERDPAQRFQTMGAFARALEQALPEIRKSACREALAELSRSTVGEAVRKRREAITRAIQIAEARALEPPRSTTLVPPAGGDEELPSLPSNMLVEDTDGAAPALHTSRPVAYTLAAMPRRKKLASAGLAAALVLGVIALMFMAPSFGGERALSARTPAAAEPTMQVAVVPKTKARAQSATTPKSKLDPRLAGFKSAVTAAPLASATVPEESEETEAEPDPTLADAQAPEPSKNWQLDPGF